MPVGYQSSQYTHFSRTIDNRFIRRQIKQAIRIRKISSIEPCIRYKYISAASKQPMGRTDQQPVPAGILCLDFIQTAAITLIDLHVSIYNYMYRRYICTQAIYIYKFKLYIIYACLNVHRAMYACVIWTQV